LNFILFSGSFIRDLAEGPDSIAIVRAVTGLASSLGITTTAEGVETKEQLDRLRSEGCTEVQGFYFSEAKPGSELAAMIRRTEIKAKAVA
jgi:EAL domain-containing protein (putative c-di-GMP-specific phosphodiesterase class I)